MEQRLVRMWLQKNANCYFQGNVDHEGIVRLFHTDDNNWYIQGTMIDGKMQLNCSKPSMQLSGTYSNGTFNVNDILNNMEHYHGTY